MRESFRRVLFASLLVTLLSLPRPALAWGNTGHEAIAYLAWQQMTPATKARVMVLLQQVPPITTATTTIPGYVIWVSQLPTGLTDDQKNRYLFMRAATWADSLKHEGLMDSDTPPPGVTVDVHIGFSDQQSHGYWHFIDTAFSDDGGAVPPTPVPNVVTQIVAFREFIASSEDDLLKAYDLAWLEHLVGDIHQPLHASVRYNAGSGDLGGNDVKIKLTAAQKLRFECAPSTFAPAELHAFWDDLPGSCSAQNGLKPGAAFALRLPHLLTKGDARLADTDPASWAADSLSVAEKDAYVAPIGPGIVPTDGTSSYDITTAYYNHSLGDAKDRVALAGARLAQLLNENLR